MDKQLQPHSGDTQHLRVPFSDSPSNYSTYAYSISINTAPGKPYSYPGTYQPRDPATPPRNPSPPPQHHLTSTHHQSRVEATCQGDSRSCAAACLNGAREVLSLAETAQHANCGCCVCGPSWWCEVSSCLCFRLWRLRLPPPTGLRFSQEPFRTVGRSGCR